MIITINPVAFKQLLPARRYWTGTEGIPVERAKQMGLPEPELLFIRNDGWSICGLRRDWSSIYALYDNWAQIIQSKAVKTFEGEEFEPSVIGSLALNL